jgi:hypothetical protein
LLADLPPVPVAEQDGKKFVLPAEKFDVLRNSENPELYAVFPYRLYGLACGDLEIGLETWRRRRIKESVGWRQDSIQAAYLGLADEAAKYVTEISQPGIKAVAFRRFGVLTLTGCRTRTTAASR